MLRLLVIALALVLIGCGRASRAADLTVVSSTLIPPTESAFLGAIVGEVRNNGKYPISYPRIVATLYDDDGRVRGTNWDYPQADQGILAPGATSPFRINVNRDKYGPKYKLQITENY